MNKLNQTQSTIFNLSTIYFIQILFQKKNGDHEVVFVLGGGRRKSVFKSILDFLLLHFLFLCGNVRIASVSGKENKKVLLNPGLAGMKDIQFPCISHEKIQSKPDNCFKVLDAMFLNEPPSDYFSLKSCQCYMQQPKDPCPKTPRKKHQYSISIFAFTGPLELQDANCL